MKKRKTRGCWGYGIGVAAHFWSFCANLVLPYFMRSSANFRQFHANFWRFPANFRRFPANFRRSHANFRRFHAREGLKNMEILNGICHLALDLLDLKLSLPMHQISEPITA